TSFPLSISSDIQTTIGPLTAVIQGMGFEVALTITPDNKGNLGPIDIQPRFVPPNGVGLELDAGGFKGGGFLRLDRARGEYEGALELMFMEIISVRAVGVLS